MLRDACPIRHSPDADAAAYEAGPSAKPLMKGRQTRAAILDAALTLASHIGLEGLSIGALAEVTGDEQVGRLRTLRLARGAADLGRPRVPRQVRGRGVPAVDARAARPAAAAGAVRSLAAPRLGRRSTRAASTSAARSNSTIARGRCATRWWRWCGPGSRRSSVRSTRRSPRATCAPTPIRSRCCSSCTASSWRCITTRASCSNAGRRGARPGRLREPASSATPPAVRRRPLRAAGAARRAPLPLPPLPSRLQESDSHGPLHPAAARHAVRAARSARRRRRAQAAAARTPRSTPRRSTR